MVKNRIHEIILESIEVLNEEMGSEIPVATDADIALFGPKSALDSLGLVNLIVSIESTIEDEYGVAMTIADERAMSQRYSPFKSVLTLTDYLDMLLKEELSVR